MCVLRSRLFHHASNPWEGETLELKVALIRATERWETLTGGGVPCPVMFDTEDAREMMELNEVQRKADKAFEMWQNMLGLGPRGLGAYSGLQGGRGTLQADEGGGIDGGHVREGKSGDHGALALGQHGQREIYVMNQARYSTSS